MERGCNWSWSLCPSDFRSVNPFWDIRNQSRMLSEIASKFWTFLPPKFCWVSPYKICTHVITPASWDVDRLVKFRKVSPTNPKVMDTHTLNFKPNFKYFSPLKFFKGSRPLSWRISRTRKNLRGQHPQGQKCSLPKKSIWVSTEYLIRRRLVVVGPKFSGLFAKRGRIVLDHTSFRYWISWLVPQIFAIKFWSCVKLTQILHVLVPNFSGEDPNFRTWIIKRTHIDHVMAKLHGDRPRELVDSVAK